jgi:soluble lytic murein transglycosylase-like protein
LYNKLCVALVAALAPLAAHAQSDYAAWARSNADGTWTAAAEAAVKASALPGLRPKDITPFCPGYATRTPGERARFWVGLLSAIARRESRFDPATSYQESFNDSQGKRVISRGLLQISFESANQRAYSCQIARPEDLHDPAVNLACGVKILGFWVKKDGVIAAYASGSIQGGGRYWSTLRENHGNLLELMAFTRKLSVCAVD